MLVEAKKITGMEILRDGTTFNIRVTVHSGDSRTSMADLGITKENV